MAIVSKAKKYGRIRTKNMQCHSPCNELAASNVTAATVVFISWLVTKRVIDALIARSLSSVSEN